MTTPTTVLVQLKLRSDTAANWTSANPTLLSGELGRETDTGKIKIGNGSTAWTALAYQPFGAPITNADISATAEIAVSKLADGTARQLLQTDAAGTGVEWASNVDVPGTLDVTGAATFDAAVTIAGDLTVNGTTTNINTTNLVVEDKNIILGDVTTPSDITADGGGITLKGATDKTITWSDTTDSWTFNQPTITTGTSTAASFIPTDSTAPSNGLYLPSSNNVAISTNGTGRIAIDASGNVNIDSNTLYVDATNNRVGIGTISPLTLLHIAGNDPAIRLEDTEGGAQSDYEVKVAASAFQINNVSASTTPFAVNNSGTVTLTSAAANAPFIANISTSEAARIDSSGRLLVGTSTALGIGDSTPAFQLVGAGAASWAGILRTGATSAGSNLVLAQTRGSASSRTIAQSGDILGTINFAGDDGVDLATTAATIAAAIDGTPGTNDMPGRLVFSTTADGASSPTERFRITNDGVKAYDQTAPAAVNATATLTIANLKAGIITSTSAAATDMTLPTGTDTQAGFSGTYDNFTFEWSVINTGPSLVRVLAGTAHTVVGSGSVATGTSGRFASRRTATNTFVTYRLS